MITNLSLVDLKIKVLRYMSLLILCLSFSIEISISSNVVVENKEKVLKGNYNFILNKFFSSLYLK